VHLFPPTLKIVLPPMRRLPVKQMFRAWMKTLLHCGSDTQPGGAFGAFVAPKFSKHCIAILTFAETFK